MLPLKLTLFGSPRLEREGQSLPLGRRKSLALLAYLAVTRQPQQRDHLLAFFWPDYDPPSARNNLRRELSVLNKKLGAGYLTTNRTQVTLNPSRNLWLDVRQFRELLAVASNHDYGNGLLCADCVRDLTTAVSLYPSDFMAGFDLPDAPAFDDWLFFERESLRQELAGALQALIGHHSSQGEVEPAISYARRWLALDPLHEPAHQALMTLYAWSGQKPAALRQYEECARLLQEELGLSPELETKSLYEEIKAKRLNGPPAPRELDGKLSPSTANAEAKERVTSHPVSPSSPAFLDEGTAAVAVDDPVFVGREAELAQLSAFLDKALAGQAGVVFVTGEAGQGKTSLLNAFARQAQESHKNLTVARGVCDVYTGVGDPFLPFRDILRMLTGDVESQWRVGAIGRDHALRLWHLLPQAVQALTEHGPDLIDTFVPANTLLNRGHDFGADGTVWLASLKQLIKRKEVSSDWKPEQSRIFEQYTTVLTSLAAAQPLLLIIDDLHWADLSSISLLAHLGRRLASHSILVIGAYRPEDVAQGREDKPHPLQTILSEFKRHMGDIWIDLDRAEMGKARAFVDALLDSEPNRLGADFRQALTEHTQGQPLFTVELLREMHARGALQQDETGCWFEEKALRVDALPLRVEGVIERRIGRLDADLREILTVASVEGESFTAEVVADVLGIDKKNVVRRLSRELNSQHLLVREAGIERLGSQRLSRFQFRHNLIQTYLYQSLGASERTFLHEAVGNCLETIYGGQEWQVAVPLARHFQEADLTPKAAGYLLQAGEQAKRLGAYEEAIEHFNRGLTLIPTLPDTRERTKQELKLQLALGSVLNVVKSWVAPEVAATYSRARELSEELGETEMRFPVLWCLWYYYASLPDWHIGANLAQELLQLATQLNDTILLTLAHRAMGITMDYLGKPVLARQHFEQAIAHYNPQDHPRYLQYYNEDPGILSLSFIANSLWILGYPDQAQERMEEALELAEDLAHPFSLARVIGGASHLYYLSRDFQLALERAEAALNLSQAEGFVFWSVINMRARGLALVGLGQGTTGISLVQQAREIEQAMGVACSEIGERTRLADAYGKVGQVDEGLDLLSEALKIVENSGERPFEIEIHWLKGELLLKSKADPDTSPEGNRLIEAEACFLKAIEIAREREAKSWELRATMSLSRLWLSQGKKEEARQLLAEIYGWFTEGFGTADLQEAKALLKVLET